MNKEIITGHQKSLLELISQNKFITKNFYLTGGTALAAFYIKHRYSEDLDFFSEKEVDMLGLDVFFRKIKKSVQFTEIEFNQSFNRNLFFLHFGKEILKIEFTYFPFPRIEKSMVQNGCQIDSLLDIAVNKLFTIYQRVASRDYIDLFFICREKGFAISDLIKKAKIKFDWHIDLIQLGAQFLKAAESSDYPIMIKNIDRNEWVDFFIKEARKFESQIIK